MATKINTTWHSDTIWQHLFYSLPSFDPSFDPSFLSHHSSGIMATISTASELLPKEVFPLHSHTFPCPRLSMSHPSCSDGCNSLFLTHYSFYVNLIKCLAPIPKNVDNVSGQRYSLILSCWMKFSFLLHKAHCDLDMIFIVIPYLAIPILHHHWPRWLLHCPPPASTLGLPICVLLFSWTRQLSYSFEKNSPLLW